METLRPEDALDGSWKQGEQYDQEWVEQNDAPASTRIAISAQQASSTVDVLKALTLVIDILVAGTSRSPHRWKPSLYCLNGVLTRTHQAYSGRCRHRLR